MKVSSESGGDPPKARTFLRHDARAAGADRDRRRRRPTRALLRTILSFSPAVEIFGEAADGPEAVRLALEQWRTRSSST